MTSINKFLEQQSSILQVQEEQVSRNHYLFVFKFQNTVVPVKRQLIEGSYEGLIENGIPHGQGILVYKV